MERERILFERSRREALARESLRDGGGGGGGSSTYTSRSNGDSSSSQRYGGDARLILF